MKTARCFIWVSSVVLLSLLVGAPPPVSARRELRVCADPNNLPFSNRRLEGFENRLAGLLGRELGATVRYTWWAQRRGFVRNTLDAGACDVIMGVPARSERLRTTEPYYRSSYSFVTRRDRALDLHSLDDPRLRRLWIGVHVVGDDYASVPPLHALSRRGIVDNVVGYSLYGDYRKDSPPAALVRGVADGEVDVALVWGPLAGYYAKRSKAKLDVVPIAAEPDGAPPMAFDIALGVRKGDMALSDELERALARREKAVKAILARFGVPQL
jgi:mxaJ protein